MRVLPMSVMHINYAITDNTRHSIVQRMGPLVDRVYASFLSVLSECVQYKRTFVAVPVSEVLNTVFTAYNPPYLLIPFSLLKLLMGHTIKN